ncbi:MAG: YvcK family protein, partial [Anaerolineae bacterium]|nr:YvcK family protein [Anaerolineae bacterium]
VAIGGGTGMPNLLRGLKRYTANLTAIVTVADDGGSSGRLRHDLGVLPPGDFRNKIAALARDEGLMTQLFQYRFGEGGLEGHSFGNLYITALAGVTGSFEQALIESSRVLNVQGRVLPSTLSDVTLMADLREEETDSTRRVAGESAIPEGVGAIERIFLQPDDAPAYPEAVRAILSADLIVLGPGSLFTSILPNLLVRGIADAVRASKALKVYVCNVATQHGETDDFTAADHVRAIERHAGKGLFEVVVANNHFPALRPDANFRYVQPGDIQPVPGNGSTGRRVTYYPAPLVDEIRPWRHNSERLGAAIMDVMASARHPELPEPDSEPGSV